MAIRLGSMGTKYSIFSSKSLSIFVDVLSKPKLDVGENPLGEVEDISEGIGRRGWRPMLCLDEASAADDTLRCDVLN
jgi:hypothetical protein